MLRICCAFLFLQSIVSVAPALADDIKDPAAQPGTIDFEKQIKPILKQSCYSCHGSEVAKDNLQLHQRKLAFPDDRDAWRIIPYDAEASDLHFVVTLPADDPDVMPPAGEGEPLTEQQVKLIEQWINEGAHWPESADELDKPVKIPLLAGELSAEQKAASDKAIARLLDKNVLAMKIARDTQAVDVNFNLLGQKVTDEDLPAMKGLEPTLVWLNLARTKVTDKGIAQLAGYTELRRLRLDNTAITDEAMPHIAKLSKLEYLNLYGTAVTDNGIRHLAELKNLKRLYLWQTKVTAEGVKTLRQALPELSIDTGEYPEVKVLEAPDISENVLPNVVKDASDASTDDADDAEPMPEE